MELTDKQSIIELLEKHDLGTKKALGQNFLIDKAALNLIVESANINKNDHILEIGPGLGVLTKEIAPKAKHITTIELDSKLIPLLRETLNEHQNIELIHGDILRFQPPDHPYKVVANIPYNITSPILNHFLQAKNKPQSMTLLIQKEVAEKVCAIEPEMTVLSLQVNLFGTPQIIGAVPASSFLPPPKVDSAIIHIQIHNTIPTEEALKILKIAKRAFSQRRKKLSNSLPDLKEKLTQLNFADLRPQNLSIKNWQNLLLLP